VAFSLHQARSAVRSLCLALGAWITAGCSGPQSALDPAGVGAERVLDLYLWMSGGALAVWVTVVALGVYLIRARIEEHDERAARRLIIGGGVLVPTVVLTVLLVFGLDLMADLLEPPTDARLRVEIVGEEWWWRVQYVPEQGAPVVSANEIRVPVGEPVVFEVTSHGVIHAFWIPALGGKIDMVPGRRNRITLEATRTGVFRGTCAEYCGMAHALMSFAVEVVPREEFDAWLAAQRADAPEPTEAPARRGAELFLSGGCGACHAVRGTPASSALGPDLTHVGSRRTIAAGILPSDAPSFRRWIASPEEVKPGARMPAYGMLSDEALDALATYMTSLR
jgi:cytochrome c oxidase subunit II